MREAKLTGAPPYLKDHYSNRHIAAMAISGWKINSNLKIVLKGHGTRSCWTLCELLGFAYLPISLSVSLVELTFVFDGVWHCQRRVTMMVAVVQWLVDCINSQVLNRSQETARAHRVRRGGCTRIATSYLSMLLWIFPGGMPHPGTWNSEWHHKQAIYWDSEGSDATLCSFFPNN